jgi:hypothetical protein
MGFSVIIDISGIVLLGLGRQRLSDFSEKTIKEKLKLDEIGGKIIYNKEIKLQERFCTAHKPRDINLAQKLLIRHLC